MTREEIKEYLNRVDKLLDKLKGEDKETLSWLIYGYNQCAKLLNEIQKENEKLKDNWNKLKEYLENKIDKYSINLEYLSAERMTQIKNKMQELEQGSDNQWLEKNMQK